MQYYYLISSLPRLRSPELQAESDIESLQLLIRENLDSSDENLFLYLLFRNDNKNLLQIMRRMDGIQNGSGNRFLQPAAFNHQQLEEGLQDIFDLPDYMQSFITDYHQKLLPSNQRLRENILKNLYYEEALQLRDPFLVRYFTFKRDLKNILSALNARRFHYPLEEVLIGDYALTEHLHRSIESDFGLGKEYPFVSEILETMDSGELGKLEQCIDRILWDFLNEQIAGDYFGSARVYAYFIKLSLGNRWLPLESKAGSTQLEELIAHVLSRANWPAELISDKRYAFSQSMVAHH